MTLELWHYGKNIHPTVPSQYYHKRFPAIQTVIQDNPGNVLISEPVNQQRRLAGMDSQEAMMRFRGFFFDLTNLPYRVQSLVPSGEPFTLRSYENLYKKMKEFRTVQDARPLLNFWNVTHFLSYAPLDSSWNLMGQDQELKIYQNPQASGNAFAMVGDRFENSATPQIFKPSFLLWNHQKIKAQFNSSQPMVAVFNLPFYPGWHLFCSCGSQHPSQPLGGYFRSVSIPEGNHTLYLKYHPLSWNLSLVLSLLVFIFLIVAGLKILQNSKRHVRSIS
ncbi:MAG: hypothetical protein HYY63_04760 [Elusimicrobia bacterium]|nr:hypothetical protein [Elusimicrobiota bacterium]